MPQTTKNRKRLTTTTDVARAARVNQQRELKKAVDREKSIQRLCDRLDAEMQRTNDKIQHLAIVLGSFSRAILTERETDRALEK